MKQYSREAYNIGAVAAICKLILHQTIRAAREIAEVNGDQLLALVFVLHLDVELQIAERELVAAEIAQRKRPAGKPDAAA